jgi:NAD(P)-dependent dehydrogenase (short-subunit alcohol dehydrogenase family)
MQGKTVVVTGASAGIGAAVARRFTELGATVVIVGRSPQRTAAVAEAIGAEPHVADFSRLADVRQLADTIRSHHAAIDILVNNAGGMFSRRTVTDDGHEMTLQVNYLAPVLLTTLLLDQLTSAADGRVIFTGSVAYRRGRLDLDDLNMTGRRFRGVRAYGTTKLATMLFMRELSRRTEGTGLSVCAVHPGAVATEVGRESFMLTWIVRLGRPLLLTAEKGAEPLVQLATRPDPQSVNGVYFHRFEPEEPKNKQAADPQFARDLWDQTQRLIGMAPV